MPCSPKGTSSPVTRLYTAICCASSRTRQKRHKSRQWRYPARAKRCHFAASVPYCRHRSDVEKGRLWLAISTHSNYRRHASSSCGCWCFSSCARCSSFVLYKQIMDRVPRQSGPERPDRRRSVHRHHPVVPAGDPSVSRSRLGQHIPPRRSRPRGRTPAGAAGADGRDPRRSRRPHGDLARRRCAAFSIRSRRGSTRRATCRATDRPAGLSRPARHLLGPDRNRRLGRQGDRRAEDRRRCRLGVRHAEGRPRRAARRHGHRVLVLAVRPRRLAGARLSRPAGGPGAEPLLHRPRGLALHHRARPRQRGRAWRRGRRCPATCGSPSTG